MAAGGTSADPALVPGPARVLAPLLLACLVLAAPTSATAAARCANADLLPTAARLARVRSATLCLLNLERAKRGLRPLRAEGELRKAAQRYSALMVRRDFFDHVSPGGSTLTTRVRNGTRYLRGSSGRWTLGENIAWGSGRLATPRRIVRSWMRSPGHRRNILLTSFRHIGIGIAIGAPTADGDRPAATYTTDFGSR